MTDLEKIIKWQGEIKNYRCKFLKKWSTKLADWCLKIAREEENNDEN